MAFASAGFAVDGIEMYRDQRKFLPLDDSVGIGIA
jgi:hypothetical protein